MPVCELLFFHGFLGDADDWHPLLSYMPQDISYTMGSLIHTSALSKPTILIGYSMGGRAAIATALAYPQLVRGIFLLSSNLGLASESAKAQRVHEERQWLEHIASKGIDSFLSRWYNQPLFAGLDKKSLMQRRKKLTPSAVAAMLDRHSIAQTPNYWEILSAIDAPLFFLFGERDTKYRKLSVRCGRLPKSFVPGATHAIHLEAPRFCAEYITQRIAL